MKTKTHGHVEFDPNRTYTGLDLRTIFDGATLTWPPGVSPRPVPGVRLVTWAEEKPRPTLESGRETGDVEPMVDLQMDRNMGRTND
jgi:hypothetical protein